MFELVFRSRGPLHRCPQREVEAAWDAMVGFSSPLEILRYDLNAQNNWKPFIREHFLADALTQRTGFVRWIATTGMGALDTGLHGEGEVVWMRQDMRVPVPVDRWGALAAAAGVDDVQLAEQAGKDDAAGRPCFAWRREGVPTVDVEGARTGASGEGRWWMWRVPAGWQVQAR